MFKPHRDDFYWEPTDEPHATRRRQILGKDKPGPLNSTQIIPL